MPSAPIKTRSATLNRLALTTALGSLAFLSYGRGAYSGSCTTTAPGTYFCTGPADPVTDIPIVISRSGPLQFTTEDGFGIDTSNEASSIAMALRSESGLSFSTGENVTIRGDDADSNYAYGGALYTRNTYGGTITIDTSGATLRGQNGLLVLNEYFGYSIGTPSPPASDILIIAGDTTATSGTALEAINRSDGIESANLTIDTTTGRVYGPSGSGIAAQQGGFSYRGTTALTITTSEVLGGDNGINATHEGSSYNDADVTINTTGGEVTGVADDGIFARQNAYSFMGTTNLTITTADVSGGSSGIVARADGEARGDSNLVVNTSAGAVSGSAQNGIFASQTGSSGDGTTNLTITTADVTASAVAASRFDRGTFEIDEIPSDYSAVVAQITGRGDEGANLVIDTTAGVITSVSRLGVAADNRATSVNGAADLSITTGDVHAAVRGIDARLATTAAGNARVNIDTTAGAVVTGQGNGIFMRNDAQSSGGDIDVSVVTGDVTSLRNRIGTNTPITPGFFPTLYGRVEGAALLLGLFGTGETGASTTIDTTGGVISSAAGNGLSVFNRATSNNGRADLTITTGDVLSSSPFTWGIQVLLDATGAHGADLTIDTTAGTITGDRPRRVGNTTIAASRGIAGINSSRSSQGTANSLLVTGAVTSWTETLTLISGANAHGDASVTVDTTAGDIVHDDRTTLEFESVPIEIMAVNAFNGAISATGISESTVRTGSVTALDERGERAFAVSLRSEAKAEGSVDMLLDTTRGLCCANRVRDSLFESSMIAGGHEQLEPYEVQDHELVGLQ